LARYDAGRGGAQRARTLMTESDAAFEARDFVRSEALLAEALALEPDDPDLLFRHGNALLQLGRPDLAEQALRASLAQRDSQLVWRIGAGEPYQAQLLLGIIASTRGAFDEAVARFETARAMNPWQTGAMVLLAATYEVLGRADLARSVVAAGLAVDPGDARLRELDQRLKAAP
ncbi:MAG TPA: tetratricopeptide repeat protein, partial [Candidatus Eisenbacteria bacterium]|nr:tetratricopeptide repeat protein [Candidatus Eisenbacteria bacterium]